MEQEEREIEEARLWAKYEARVAAEQAQREEEKVVSPLRSKGKDRVQVQELDLGEVTGFVCDLCDKKGIPCQWGKVSA